MFPPALADRTGPTHTDRRQAAVILAPLYCGYLLSFAARIIFGLALKPIKAARHFSDSQLAPLSGIVFATTCATFCPPDRMTVDRRSYPPLAVSLVGVPHSSWA